jgi:hypothetical protein
MGDKFILNGQKIWSTRAIFADWVFGLFRSDPTSSRHHGLSYTGALEYARHHRASHSCHQWRALCRNLLRRCRSTGGEPAGRGQGLACGDGDGRLRARPAAALSARYQRSAQKLVDLYLRNQVDADRDHSIRDAVLRAWQGAEAYTLSSYHTVGRLNKGAQIGAEASTNKIVWSELDIMIHETAMRILARAVLLIDDAEANEWLEGSCSRRPVPSTRQQRDPAQHHRQRMLGLPKS